MPPPESRQNPQQVLSVRFPWSEFSEHLIAQIRSLEAETYKLIRRSGRGWQQDFKRKTHRQIKYLEKIGTLPPGSQNKRVFVPRPHLKQVKSAKNQKVFVAYLIAEKRGRRADDLAHALSMRTGTLRQRVYEFKKNLERSGIPKQRVVEEEFAWFRFYDSMPGGKGVTRNLPPLSSAPWDPTAALSEFEKTEIARLCSNPGLTARSRHPRGCEPSDASHRDPRLAIQPKGDGGPPPRARHAAKNRKASRC